MDFTKIKGYCLSVLSLLMAATAQAQTSNPPGVCYEIFVRFICRFKRGRHRRYQRHHFKTGLPERAGRGRTLADTPFCKSPTYHKYDVMDYRQIDPELGDDGRFQKGCYRRAHKRKIRIIKDLVVKPYQRPPPVVSTGPQRQTEPLPRLLRLAGSKDD